MTESSLITTDQSLDVLRETIAYAKTRPISAAEVGLSAGGGLSVTVRNGDVESIEHHQDKTLSVTVYRDQRKGTATTTDFSTEGIRETVAAADEIAQVAEADPYAGLIDPDRLATDIPDLDLDHPWTLEPDAAIALALRCDSSAREADPRVDQTDDISVSRHRGLRGYATTDGFAAAYHGTRHGLSCVVVGKADAAMQRGYWYTVARDAADLEAPEPVGTTATARTCAKLGARKVTTETVPVIFEAPVAGGLIGHLVSAVSGGSLYRKASFLLDAAGTQIFPEHVTITEQPHLGGAMGSAPFDGEGAATHDRALIDSGVLTGYVLDSYAARRLELTPTGNAGGVHNLTVSHQDLDFDQLVATMGRGLVVTDLMGFGVNMVTGDYSRGASGFWVEDGAVAYPVEEITIAGNLADMFQNIVACANDVDQRGNIRSGSILIDRMTVAGA